MFQPHLGSWSRSIQLFAFMYYMLILSMFCMSFQSNTLLIVIRQPDLIKGLTH